jgi:CHAT domain-containing protein/Flp pilus assembly protein TadD
MRWRFLLLVFVTAACSRRPPARQAYSEAWTEFRQGRLPRAQQLVEAALKNHAGDRPKDALQPLRLLQTEILLVRGQPRTALDLLGQLSDPQDPDLHLRWLVDRADGLWRQGQADKATELLEEVDRIAGSTGGGDWVFKSLLLRGAMLANAGRFDQAEDVLRKLLERATVAGDTYNRASALLNLSFSKLRRNRYDESIKYSSPALELAETIHAGRIAAVANDNLGIAYTVLHDLDRAADHQNKAIAQLREIDDLRNLEDALGGLGNIHLLGHKPELAAQDFEEAFAIAKRTDVTEDAVRWAGRLAFALIEQKNWSAAESWNRQAYALREQLKNLDQEPYLQLNTAAIANGRGNFQEAQRLYLELISESKGVPYVEWDAHMRLGSLLAGKEQFGEANAEYERGLAAIERVRSGLLQDDYRLTYHDLQMEFFKDYVELLVTEGNTERALQVVEYSRARVLAEKLGLQPGAISQVHPADFQRYAGRTGSVLVSYWLAPQRSFVWVIKPDRIHMRELPPAREIGELIRNYRKTIEEELRDPVEEQLPQAASLSKVLLGPIHDDLAGARKVVIVPDDELHALNLETLPAPAAGRYWIEDVEIAIAPSLSVLAETPARSRSKPSLLLIGAPVSASAEYPALPAAKAEIDEIQSRFAGAGVVRTGLDATPRGFLDAMPSRFSMIHFAAHAETNPQSPLESAVILSRNGDSYKLYARDVAQLQLSADLVTISACRSAGARAYGGEGLVGFAWAFLQSGARAVIAGLWDVSDSSSSRLMATLYESLASGAEPATARRRAKLTLLHSSGPFRKPFYWAPYQIYIR